MEPIVNRIHKVAQEEPLLVRYTGLYTPGLEEDLDYAGQQGTIAEVEDDSGWNVGVFVNGETKFIAPNGTAYVNRPAREEGYKKDQVEWDNNNWFEVVLYKRNAEGLLEEQGFSNDVAGTVREAIDQAVEWLKLKTGKQYEVDDPQAHDQLPDDPTVHIPMPEDWDVQTMQTMKGDEQEISDKTKDWEQRWRRKAEALDKDFLKLLPSYERMMRVLQTKRHLDIEEALKDPEFVEYTQKLYKEIKHQVINGKMEMWDMENTIADKIQERLNMRLASPYTPFDKFYKRDTVETRDWSVLKNLVSDYAVKKWKAQGIEGEELAVKNDKLYEDMGKKKWNAVIEIGKSYYNALADMPEKDANYSSSTTMTPRMKKRHYEMEKELLKTPKIKKAQSNNEGKAFLNKLKDYKLSNLKIDWNSYEIYRRTVEIIADSTTYEDEAVELETQRSDAHMDVVNQIIKDNNLLKPGVDEDDLEFIVKNIVADQVEEDLNMQISAPGDWKSQVKARRELSVTYADVEHLLKKAVLQGFDRLANLVKEIEGLKDQIEEESTTAHGRDLTGSSQDWYEFNVKMYGSSGPDWDMSKYVPDQTYWEEIGNFVQSFVDGMKEDFPWIGEWGQVGRSGGYIALQDGDKLISEAEGWLEQSGFSNQEEYEQWYGSSDTPEENQQELENYIKEATELRDKLQARQSDLEIIGTNLGRAKDWLQDALSQPAYWRDFIEDIPQIEGESELAPFPMFERPKRQPKAPTTEQWEQRWRRHGSMRKKADDMGYYYADERSPDGKYIVFKADDEDKAKVMAKEMGLTLAGGFFFAGGGEPNNFEEYVVHDATGITAEQVQAYQTEQEQSREQAEQAYRAGMIASYDEGDIAQAQIEYYKEDILEKDFVFDDNEEIMEIADQVKDMTYPQAHTEFWKRVKDAGLEDELNELIEKSVYDDTDMYTFAWEDFQENLTQAMQEVNPSNEWYAKGEDMGWQNQSGEADVTASNAEELLEKIAPRISQYSIWVWKDGAHKLRIKLSHHDSPMGEYYYLSPAKEDLSIEEWEQRWRKKGSLQKKAEITKEEVMADLQTAVDAFNADFERHPPLKLLDIDEYRDKYFGMLQDSNAIAIVESNLSDGSGAALNMGFAELLPAGKYSIDAETYYLIGVYPNADYKDSTDWEQRWRKKSEAEQYKMECPDCGKIFSVTKDKLLFIPGSEHYNVECPECGHIVGDEDTISTPAQEKADKYEQRWRKKGSMRKKAQAYEVGQWVSIPHETRGTLIGLVVNFDDYWEEGVDNENFPEEGPYSVLHNNRHSNDPAEQMDYMDSVQEDNIAYIDYDDEMVEKGERLAREWWGRYRAGLDRARIEEERGMTKEEEKGIQDWEQRWRRGSVKMGAFTNLTVQTSQIPKELISQIKKVQKGIDKDKLVTDEDEKGWIEGGLQKKFHITILYGVETKEEDKIAEIVKEYVGKGISCESKDVEYFDKDDCTVAVLRMDGTQGLANLHKALKKEVKNKHKFPQFKAHLTIAYLKKGERLEDEKIKKVKWQIDNIEMSRKNGSLVKVSKMIRKSEVIDIDDTYWVDSLSDFVNKFELKDEFRDLTGQNIDDYNVESADDVMIEQLLNKYYPETKFIVYYSEASDGFELIALNPLQRVPMKNPEEWEQRWRRQGSKKEAGAMNELSIIIEELPTQSTEKAIDKIQPMPSLWYENEEGKRYFLSQEELNNAVFPEGYKIQHSLNPQVTETVIDTDTNGEYSFNTTINCIEPIVLYLVQKRGWSLVDAVTIASQTCEHCLNILIEDAGGEKYPEDQKYHCNTWCELCKVIDPEHDAWYNSETRKKKLEENQVEIADENLNVVIKESSAVAHDNIPFRRANKLINHFYKKAQMEEYKTGMFVIFTQECRFKMDQLDAMGEIKENMIGKVNKVLEDAVLIEIGKQIYEIPFLEAFKVMEPFRAQVTSPQGQEPELPGKEQQEMAEEPEMGMEGEVMSEDMEGEGASPVRPGIGTERAEITPQPIKPMKPLEKALQVEQTLKDMWKRYALEDVRKQLQPGTPVRVNNEPGKVRNAVGNDYQVEMASGDLVIVPLSAIQLDIPVEPKVPVRAPEQPAQPAQAPKAEPKYPIGSDVFVVVRVPTSTQDVHQRKRGTVTAYEDGYYLVKTHEGDEITVPEKDISLMSKPKEKKQKQETERLPHPRIRRTKRGLIPVHSSDEIPKNTYVYVQRDESNDLHFGRVIDQADNQIGVEFLDDIEDYYPASQVYYIEMPLNLRQKMLDKWKTWTTSTEAKYRAIMEKTAEAETPDPAIEELAFQFGYNGFFALQPEDVIIKNIEYFTKIKDEHGLLLSRMLLGNRRAYDKGKKLYEDTKGSKEFEQKWKKKSQEDNGMERIILSEVEISDQMLNEDGMWLSRDMWEPEVRYRTEMLQQLIGKLETGVDVTSQMTSYVEDIHEILEKVPPDQMISAGEYIQKELGTKQFGAEICDILLKEAIPQSMSAVPPSEQSSVPRPQQNPSKKRPLKELNRIIKQRDDEFSRIEEQEDQEKSVNSTEPTRQNVQTDINFMGTMGSLKIASKFSSGQEVEILTGIYKGQKGIIKEFNPGMQISKERTNPNTYRVRLGDTDTWKNEDELKVPEAMPVEASFNGIEADLKDGFHKLLTEIETSSNPYVVSEIGKKLYKGQQKSDSVREASVSRISK